MTARADARKHVFHLLPRLNRDGTTHMVATLLKGVDRQAFRITLCGLSPGNADLTELDQLSDEIHVLAMRNFFDLRVLIPLYRLLKRSRVDILHTHRVRPDIVGRIAGRLARIPINISTQHYVDEWYERGAVVYRVVRRLFIATMPLCDSVACNSAAEREVLLREIGTRYRDRCCVIHNGLDTDKFSRPSETQLAALRQSLELAPRARVISVVAYLTERKGHRYLLEALARIRTSCPDIVLLVVGDGPQQAQLVEQAEALGISDHTRFLGNREDVAGILALSEISVLPSLWEPFGLAALEAMAMKTPVVASDCGGLAEFVAHAENGLLVPPADARAIADAVAQLLADDSLRREMGARAQATVLQRFTARHVADAYQQLYDRTLAGISPARSKKS